jgi:hypothetical protein
MEAFTWRRINANERACDMQAAAVIAAFVKTTQVQNWQLTTIVLALMVVLLLMMMKISSIVAPSAMHTRVPTGTKLTRHISACFTHSTIIWRRIFLKQKRVAELYSLWVIL